MVENYNELALEVLRDWLYDKFDDADLLQIMNDDPDCAQLLSDEWDKVYDAMRQIKLISVHME